MLSVRILQLLKSFTLMNRPVPLSVISMVCKGSKDGYVRHLLSDMKAKGWIDVKGNRTSYCYFITPKGLEILAWRENNQIKKNHDNTLDLIYEVMEVGC